MWMIDILVRELKSEGVGEKGTGRDASIETSRCEDKKRGRMKNKSGYKKDRQKNEKRISYHHCLRMNAIKACATQKKKRSGSMRILLPGVFPFFIIPPLLPTS